MCRTRRNTRAVLPAWSPQSNGLSGPSSNRDVNGGRLCARTERPQPPGRRPQRAPTPHLDGRSKGPKICAPTVSIGGHVRGPMWLRGGGGGGTRRPSGPRPAGEEAPLIDGRCSASEGLMGTAPDWRSKHAGISLLTIVRASRGYVKMEINEPPPSRQVGTRTTASDIEACFNVARILGDG